MAGVDKLVEKMKRQPNNIKFSEAEKVLRAYGYELTRIKGSHHIFKNKISGDRWPLPFQKPLKPYLIKQLLKRIEEE
ncbi:type II toxin-antitoxin system HicA family toxin [Lacicoccus qingdaonensis]|uniref:Predicted RNA binding protein YcfA, dsRBD-like fold, HicA-like mRNA interferase family n=1 Tax=Lacicoccus qingdaonensis TaxID=576118 RepID=A0A1G9AUK6_9BACL|nr:type II toxin-antitoxin system HicA family toxin [Salinicoccus qingdaonensis]SDK30942.1 Predicted RNA binding protein YcfA, dsRBD-like fold, HicA-like mRNA interferase family [Salinicoccus qingdaonensis]